MALTPGSAFGIITGVAAIVYKLADKLVSDINSA